MKKNGIYANNWIERSNVLNEMRTPLNLTEMRLLLVYQSKINARDINTVKVTFTLESFQKIMDIKNIDISALKKNMKRISQRSIEVPYKNGFQFIPLYQRCGLYQNSDGEWCIDLECNQEMLPYMFEMKKNYFKYQLWNSIKLTSLNQIRMYEILKQYEKIGKRKVSIEELKCILGIDIKQYSQYRDFKRYVLDVCQKALEENTDIKYTYKPIKGAKGKVLSVEFTITKNNNFKDDLRLEEFIKSEDLEDINEENPVQVEKSEKKPVEKEKVELGFNFDNSYLPEQLENLLDIAKSVSDKPEAYLKSIYYQIKARNKNISNLYNYTLAIINADLKNVSKSENPKKQSENPKKESSILDDYDEWWFEKIRTKPFEDTQTFEFDSNMYSTGNIDRLLRKKFNIDVEGIYNYKISSKPGDLKKLIEYVYDTYNLLLIDTNTAINRIIPPPEKQREVLQDTSSLNDNSSLDSIQLEKVDTYMNKNDLNVALDEDEFDKILYDNTLPWEE